MATNETSHVKESTQAVAERVLRRSRRRQLLLAGFAGFFWLLLAASVIGIALCVVAFTSPIQNLLVQKIANGAAVEPLDMQLHAEAMLLATRVLYNGSIVLAVLLIMAGGGTLLYVRASHRANLQRIQTELADISSQLRLLCRASQKGRTP